MKKCADIPSLVNVEVIGDGVQSCACSFFTHNQKVTNFVPPFSFSASICACKTFSLISEVLQKPSRAGKGREVLLARFLSKNCKQQTYNYHYCCNIWCVSDSIVSHKIIRVYHQLARCGGDFFSST